MGNTRRWSPRTEEGVERVFEDLWADGKRTLGLVMRYWPQEVPIPSEGTIKDRLKRFREADEPVPWKLTEATEAEAAATMPVLAAVAQHTEGRVTHLTRRQAVLVCRVHAAAPDLDPSLCYRVALSYLRRRDEPAEDLDLFLALAPWRSKEATDRFWSWVKSYRPQWLREVAEGTVLRPANEGVRLAIRCSRRVVTELIDDPEPSDAPFYEAMSDVVLPPYRDQAISDAAVSRFCEVLEQKLRGAPPAGALTEITPSSSAEGGSEKEEPNGG